MGYDKKQIQELEDTINAISGVVLVLGVVFITLNIVVDIIVAYLDPRIRLLKGGIR
jgi:peptide/nickel transport system permease protein